MKRPEPNSFSILVSGITLIQLTLIHVIVLVFWMSFAVGFVFAQDNTIGWQDKVREQIQLSAAPNAIWSVSVIGNDGSDLLSINGDTYLRPASNLKLITSATVLDALGDDFVFETYIHGKGELLEGVWHGDIIIKGSGDPSIDGHFYGGDKLYVLNSLADQLKKLGINRITGDLSADISIFDDKPYPNGWEWDDLTYYYSPKISPLSFNGNVVNLEVRASGNIGSKPEISWFPFNTDYIEFINEQVITSLNSPYLESYSRLPGSNKILLRSSLPQGYVEKEPLTVPKPALYFLDVFSKILSSQGIIHHGQHRFANRYDDTHLYPILAVHRSVPLSTMLAKVNTDSDNFYTEMLLKAAVYYSTDKIGDTNSGIQLATSFLHRMRIDTTHFYLKDGSGLASFNLVTTTGLARFLHEMRGHNSYGSYLSSLATIENNSNVRNRFRQSVIGSNLLVKTGYISGVRAISGYLVTFSGQSVSFSIITNNYPIRTSLIDRTHLSILELIYENL
jgi:D-alanyl-D-alanine carboxypeptidase/D-alanyl-D-alanine-endopeptidase (penicillin-binding protein 4)